MLRIDNLSFSFPDSDAQLFEDLSLSVGEREFVALVGPNGCGKTTLSQLVIKALKPDKGDISLDGKPLTEITARDLARIVSYLPQKIPDNVYFSVADMVVMGRYPYKTTFQDYDHDDYAIAKRYMELLDISSLAKTHFYALSGGEQRRVMLAQALTTESKMLVLDEPDAYLDLEHRLSLYSVLADINRRFGKTILVISHDIQLAVKYTHRILGLKKGSLVADVAAKEITPKMLLQLFNVNMEIISDGESVYIKY